MTVASSIHQALEDSLDIDHRLRHFRTRSNMSLRQLANKAGVSPSYVAQVEAGRISPTIATLHKLLTALGTDLASFLFNGQSVPEGDVFRREDMQVVMDRHRRYTFVLPQREDLDAEVLDEEYHPGETPEFEALASDLAGYVLDGEIVLEVEGEDAQILRPGDGFYLHAGRPARARCGGEETARIVTFIHPPRY